MVGGMSKIIYSAATLAKVLGYYEKAGIDVYPIDEPAGGDATTALVSGQVDGAMGYYNHTVDVASKGKQVECVVQIGVTPGHAVMVPPNSSIKSAKDWKGKTLGITETGSSTDFELQYIAKRAGVPLRDDQIAHSLYSLEAAHSVATRLLANGVTGIVCASDPMALGAIRAARRAGLSVPGDVSIVGYDDSALMNCTDPPLTTVRQPLVDMGRVAAETLIAATRGEPFTAEHVLPTTLVRRESL
jgi:ABC-type nitrate/sulfonate/bicarbonate transport system substrate-binding protein